MTGGKLPRGYTIVEVLIFMAVSGMMFLLAANFINGRQSAAEFKQGMSDIEAKINATLNDVTNGNYPSPANFTCSVPVPTDPNSTPRITRATVTAQGENKGCIFLGKVIQFGVNIEPERYSIHSITSRQSDQLGAPVRSFASAKPITINSTAINSSAYFDPSASSVNLTEQNRLQYGLEIERALLCTGDCSAGTPIGSFGFFGSLGNYGISTNADPQSGAQTVVTAVIPLSSLGETGPAGAQTINNNARNISSSHTLGGGRYILLCFLNGNRAGSIKIGGANNRQLTTQVELGAGVPSVC